MFYKVCQDLVCCLVTLETFLEILFAICMCMGSVGVLGEKTMRGDKCENSH